MKHIFWMAHLFSEHIQNKSVLWETSVPPSAGYRKWNQVGILSIHQVNMVLLLTMRQGGASCRTKNFRKEDSYPCEWTLFRKWVPIMMGTDMLGWGWLRWQSACLACMGPGFFLQLWGKGHTPIFSGSLLLHSLSMAKSTQSESDPPVLNKLGFAF